MINNNYLKFTNDLQSIVPIWDTSHLYDTTFGVTSSITVILESNTIGESWTNLIPVKRKNIRDHTIIYYIQNTYVSIMDL